MGFIVLLICCCGLHGFYHVVYGMGFMCLLIFGCVLHGFIVLLIFGCVLHGFYQLVNIWLRVASVLSVC